jgi:uncharacterized protein (DUF4213/DUF364 family)
MRNEKQLWTEFRTLIKMLSKTHIIPKITDIFIPEFKNGQNVQKSNFCALKIGKEGVGLSHLLFAEEQEKPINENFATIQQSLIGQDPVDLAMKLGETDPINHILAMAAVNAISQFIIHTHAIPLDYTTDPLGLLNIQSSDHIGMVGFFGPLIPIIERLGARLIIIEKKKEYVQQSPTWKVTLDPKELLQCNKVLCTSTTVLNGTLDEILLNCEKATMISIIGPTAGFLPDLLFLRHVDVVGGRCVINPDLFFQNLRNNTPWNSATKKYCFQKRTYKKFY